MKLQGIGIPFFSEKEWLSAKRLMEDAHTFHDTYPEFVKAVENAERNLRAQGIACIRVNLVMDQFIPWCRSTGRQVDSKARSDYAALRVKELDQNG